MKNNNIKKTNNLLSKSITLILVLIYFSPQLQAQEKVKMTFDNKEAFVFDSSRITFKNNNSNIFIGEGTGLVNKPDQSAVIAGENNTFAGFWSGIKNSTGHGNTFLGSFSGIDNTIGYNNTAVGSNALEQDTSGYNNSAFGSSSLLFLKNGGFNIGIGHSSGKKLTSGSMNLLLGHKAGSGDSPLSYSNNVCIGAFAGYNNSKDNRLYISNSISPKTNPLIYGDFANDTVKVFGTFGIKDEYTFPSVDGTNGQTLTSNGTGALSWTTMSSVDSLNDLGDVIVDYSTSLNMIAGKGGRNMLSTAESNTGFGYISLRDMTSGDRNSAFGSRTLYLNTTGEENNAFGSHALAENTMGDNNIAIGNQSLFHNLTGSENVGIGNSSNFHNTLGNKNTTLGYEAGYGMIGNSISGSVMIGYKAGYSETTSDKLYIENSDSTTPLIYGDFDDDYVNINGKHGIGIGNDLPTHQFVVKSGDVETMRLIGSLGSYGHGAKINFGDADVVHISEPLDDQLYLKANDIELQADYIGFGRRGTTNRIEVDGDASKTTAGSWIANSDRRIKTEVSSIKNSFETITKLRPVTFKYTEEWKKNHPSIKDQYYYNFIAQEYGEVFPESVQGSGEYIDGDEKEIIQIDTYNAQIVTIQAVKDLIEENNELKSRLEKLESQLGNIMASMAEK